MTQVDASPVNSSLEKKHKVTQVDPIRILIKADTASAKNPHQGGFLRLNPHIKLMTLL